METDLGLHHSGNPRVCAPRGQLQTTLEHHLTTSTSHRGKSCWPGVTASPTNCLDWVNSFIDLLAAIKTHLQEEGVLSPHGGHTWSTQFGREGKLCHWILQDTYYIRPHYQDTESKQLYLIYRIKHREAAKMRRKRNMAQMKEQNKTPEK